ncbi:MAG: nickel-responsive transcriptional regulator NikR [Thaumarchaeota archaeon]|nr:nickel-responsive transcriptional regulator NikR [Nitrososphaerota archaeon]
MSKIVRTGVSFPEELLKSFDRIIEELGIGSRSQAIQEAIRDFISMNSWRISGEDVAGAILLHYSHEEHGLEERITDVQHEFMDIIPSTLHLHLSKEDCLLIIAVRGKASRVKELLSRLRRVGRIKQLTHLIMPTY